LTLSEALRRARVSRNAFYTLARRPTVVPGSVVALARALGAPVSSLLVEPGEPPQERAMTLLREARAIHARHPRSSFENIWHTLQLLEESPGERLQGCLTRGRGTARHR
jgi:hypothetical protein